MSAVDADDIVKVIGLGDVANPHLCVNMLG